MKSTGPLLLILLLVSCSVPKTTVPVGILTKEMPQVPLPDAIAAQVPPGYKAEVFMQDLNWPTSVDFDASGNVYVAEAGYVYGDPFAPARIFRISQSGEINLYADSFIGPITDILWHQNQLYVSHRGKISTVGANGAVQDVVTGLPSYGDHFNNQMTVGPDGKIYFGQGVATNSGVVGLDNAYPYIWLLLWPDVHDIPAKDIKLARESFLTPQASNVLARQGNLLSLASNVTYAVTSIFNRNKNTSLLVRTRGFQPFGEHKRIIKGQTKASGTILRMSVDGSGLEVFAWGLRNPFGVMWGPDGQLYVTDNAYDERGSRPIANAKDNIYQIRQDGWYGYPDYSSGIPVTDPQFQSERGSKLKFLMAEHPPVEQPWLTRPENAASTKFDFSTNDTFGYKGHMFLAEFGPATPITSDPHPGTGYVVVRIDPTTKEAQPFLSNSAPGPEGLESVVTPGPRHPVEGRFSPDGQTLYVVDIGVIHGDVAGAGPFPLPVPGTGVIWRITKAGATSAGPPANLSPLPARMNSPVPGK
ncbi:PQQ-dependent sugar dehydrogenase [Pontibacter sp. BT310]|uniref:PQQ-dependent sugar dehydrogenase n=1 Tax=Pontibacter populi TaxID=890055 RepID=A0ABS6XAR0_9BACT|nr:MULTISPECIES: PQQ-dependent sugar dehydrogenase [Pontibacter]MBJ6118144.1 PQQ-dependent sugar dehydrogenase [Pontibacter sp. BT310]MBR0570571.1 PQQ-dependent sugar dehydrogenase [Microvirga sp. STS03]MBW3364997.1 PQQ-dependent sugar dehydrogenase [Pontibacter populi]